MQKEYMDLFNGRQTTPKKLVVIIDDSQTVCKIIETCLRREGFAVQSFPDGIEAIRSFIQPGTRLPDLIMLDINLPKMNGYAVARHLKAKPAFEQCPIVILSRYVGMLEWLRGRLAGARAHLGKPFKTYEIVTTVTALIGPATDQPPSG